MATTIKGIRIEEVNISSPTVDGGREIRGQYSIISNTDIVLAKNGFNGYEQVKIAFSPDTQKAFQVFLAGVKKDTQATLGIEEV